LRKVAIAGMFDVLDNLPDYIRLAPAYMAAMFPHIPIDMAVRWFKDVDWEGYKATWYRDQFEPVFARINPDHCYLLVEKYKERGSFIGGLMKHSWAISPPVVSLLCTETPPDVYSKLIPLYRQIYSSSQCLRCNFVASSKRSYKEHRMECDPENKCPNPHELTV
jgi:hypothetical protein